MTKLNVVIVEDEMIIAEDIADILEGGGYKVCGIGKSYQTGIDLVKRHNPDILLLDIKLKGDKDGVDLAQTIRSDYNIPFVFISSHSDPSTVKRAAAANPYGYLIKPFDDKDVLVAIEIALANFAKESPFPADNFILNNCLFIRQNNMAIKLAMDDIAYIKADGNYSVIQTHDKNYVLRSTLKDLAPKLVNGNFYRTHKSFIVNLSKITAVNSDYVFINEEKLPIGRSQYHELMEYLNKV